MLLNPTTHKIQSDLAIYCRSGNRTDLPGVNERGLRQYHRLVNNIINDSLEAAFPITRKLLQSDEWSNLVQEFFIRHACVSPQVWWMPHEFYRYIVDNNHSIINNYPILPDLLMFEWLEVELFMMEDLQPETKQKKQTPRDLLVLNPEHRLVRFNYPVHLKISSQIKPDDQGDYFLLLHREPETGKVIFTDVSVFFARMIEILGQRPSNAKELISITAADFNLDLNEPLEQLVDAFIQSAIKSQLIFYNSN